VTSTASHAPGAGMPTAIILATPAAAIRTSRSGHAEYVT
jgi:hypothetical protein